MAGPLRKELFFAASLTKFYSMLEISEKKTIFRISGWQFNLFSPWNKKVKLRYYHPLTSSSSNIREALFWIRFILIWIRNRILRSVSWNNGSGSCSESDLKSKKYQFSFTLFSIKNVFLQKKRSVLLFRW